MLYKAYFCLQNDDGLKDVQNVLSATYNRVTCLGGYVYVEPLSFIYPSSYIFVFKIFPYFSDHLSTILRINWVNLLQPILEIKPIELDQIHLMK